MEEYSFNARPHYKELLGILGEVLEKLKHTNSLNNRELRFILNRHPKGGKEIFRRSQLVVGYRELVEQKAFPKNNEVLQAIRMKPVRTQSGVTPVTVLTKPFPCPGKCIFCPNDVRMPKSYLRDEPGAQRAERNQFDPYLQTYNRLLAFQNTGHNVDKVELIILGGTWSFYPEYYQIWFIKRCFDAFNDFGVYDGRAEIQTHNVFEGQKHPGGSGENRLTYNKIILKVAGGKVDSFFTKTEYATWSELEAAQEKNETAHCRNVGLVIETRPDSITEKEVKKIRHFGATKVQIGIQSLRDTVMAMNKRGHGQKETIHAIELLRLAGFKIHAHWMPNLYGATANGDILDYKKLWGKNYSPDELKIYPTSVIENTELDDLLKIGKHVPYSFSELLKVLTTVIPQTPRYARLTRIIRDIPSTDIVAGNKLTNFRQIAEDAIKKMDKKLTDIRGREVKNLKIAFEDLELETIQYETSVSTEYFLSYKTKLDDKIAGFLRLSLPQKKLSEKNFFKELENCAMIREVHVYGQVVGIGKKSIGQAQHLGLGTKLMAVADEIAKKNGWKKMAVISAIGTREYYRNRGFSDLGLYLTKKLY